MHTLGFTTAKALTLHFEKHRWEFQGVKTEADYLELADVFLGGAKTPDMLECWRKSDRNLMRFDPTTQHLACFCRITTSARSIASSLGIETPNGFKSVVRSRLTAVPTTFTCPVCAYSLMPYPADEGNICPCCGTEFGFDDDLGVSYRELRDHWLEQGAPWFSPVDDTPPHWDPIEQLVQSEFEFTPPTWLDEDLDAVELVIPGAMLIAVQHQSLE